MCRVVSCRVWLPSAAGSSRQQQDSGIGKKIVNNSVQNPIRISLILGEANVLLRITATWSARKILIILWGCITPKNTTRNRWDLSCENITRHSKESPLIFLRSSFQKKQRQIKKETKLATLHCLLNNSASRLGFLPKRQILEKLSNHLLFSYRQLIWLRNCSFLRF